jgi:hypothetical protein
VREVMAHQRALGAIREGWKILPIPCGYSFGGELEQFGQRDEGLWSQMKHPTKVGQSDNHRDVDNPIFAVRPAASMAGNF